MDTDDVVQQTLLNVLSKVESFEPEHKGAFHGYLRRSVLNQIRDQIRVAERLGPKEHASFSAVPGNDASPLEEAIGAETLDRYERALEALKPEERSLIIARIELGFEYEDIAREFEKSTPDAARMALSRALLRLAREMGV